MLKKSIFFVFVVFSMTHAEPYRYERLYHGGTKKTIDFIYDVHVHLSDMNNKTHLNISDSVQTLYDTIIEMSKQDHQIDLLWESNAQQDQPEDTTKGTWQNASRESHGSLFNCSRFWLKEQLQNSNVHFIDADTYRDISAYNSIRHLEINKNFNSLFASITDLLKEDSKIEQDFKKLASIDEKIHKILYNAWIKYKETTIQPFVNDFLTNSNTTYGSKLIKATGALLIPNTPDIRDALKAFNSFLCNLMNFELLIKIFASTNNHCIVYAGGAHCKNVAKTLTKVNFQSIINIGRDKMDYSSDIYKNTSLPSTTWQLLKSNPKDHIKKINVDQYEIKSINRTITKENGIYLQQLINKLDNTQELFDTIDVLQNGDENFPFGALNIIRKIYLAAIKKNRPDILQKLIEKYPEYINMKSNDDHTLLTSIKPGLFSFPKKSLDILIAHNIDLNMQDINGNTALHHAALQNFTKMYTYLKEHGADETIKNYHGQLPKELTLTGKMKSVINYLSAQ